MLLIALLFTGCPNSAGAEKPEPPAPPKHTITFSVDGTGGMLKATAGGSAINSGNEVEEGKTVTFTATPAAGYRVKGWTLDGTAIAEAGTNPSYTLTVTTAINVTVSFEPKKALLTLKADKNTVKVKAKTKDGSAIKVEGCDETTLANDTETTLTVTNPERKLALIGDIIELNCSGEAAVGGNRPLIALDASGLTALQKLNCQYNKITALDVQGLTELQELYCNSNTLTVLDVHGLTKLEKLDCNVNGLTALNVSGCTALKELICNSNRELSTLDVQGCTALQKLDCSGNKLTALDVSGLTELQKLDCSDNQLSTFNVQGLTSLKVLECYSNRLTSLNVQGCTSLQVLNCHNNKLTELNVQGLKALQELDCRKNQLTSLNVQGLTALQTLGCFDNKLNAQAMTELLNALPAREAGDNAIAVLYTEFSGEEGNCKDYTQPAELKTAFDGAKKRHWRLRKLNANGKWKDI